MAKFIPHDLKITGAPDSEKKVFNSLKELDDDNYIFHSLKWLNKSTDVSFGEADFIIFNPKKGMLIIEVKGGNILYSDNKIYQINKVTKEKKIINPLEQADRTKYKLKKVFQKYYFKIESAIWLTDVIKDNRQKLPLNYHFNIILDRNSFKNTSKSINDLFNFYNMNCKKISEEEITEILNTLNPSFSFYQSLASEIENEKEVIKYMTYEQAKILDYLEEEKYASIKGDAGTGKTFIALEKASRIKDGKTLFLCYNTFLAKSLSLKYRKKLKNVDFYNLDKFLFTFGNDKNYFNDKEKILNLIKWTLDNNFIYKNIIIDEGQDFTKEQLNLFYKKAKEQGGIFYLFYDSNQLINKNTILEEWEDPIKKSVLKLTINCRNTKNIAYFSKECIINNEQDINVKIMSEIIGEKIKYLFVDNKNKILKELNKLLKFYLNNKIKAEDIVIVSLKSEEKSLLKDIINLGDNVLTSNLERNANQILKTTVRKYKGLESDIVIVVDLDKETLKEEDLKNLLYVSASRAKNILHIISEIELEKLNFIMDNSLNIKDIIEKMDN